ncbi:hypothetical protein BO82DRAFT_414824 [Aspergillus uvarum CBS 121591]|uniref:LysM domain-containing protein n=1 Tax=Aspergillus uvarum CBS 121591 TaxID=1448315 RepID=A0A319CT34_9EURO|nr:hypothetical protein BO82DRAFT_414824 [Aspergillus uvarum CBS 121591]PYH81903.1 hypothetical protein BO82DRAFT_414824 [Aspergillus uvarum CBS 121591]
MHLSLLLSIAFGHLVYAYSGHHGAYHVHHRRDTTTPTPTTTTTTTTAVSLSVLPSPDKPTVTGTVSTCNAWYDVVEGDSCWSITTALGITQAQFEEWNPAVGSTCLVEVGVSYCVGVGAVVSSTTSSASTPTSTTGSVTPTSSFNSTITANTTATMTTPYSILSYNTTTNPVTITNTNWPPSETQTGQPSYCNNWYQATQNDDCTTIVSQYSTWMDLDDFLDWNPGVGENCTNIYYGYWYCVGIAPQTSYTDNGTATSLWYPSWTYSAPPAMNTSFSPSPAQAGMASDCQDYYITESNDTCTSIVSFLGYITEEQFIAWNPAVGTDCSDIQSGYYYCIWSGTSLPMPSTTATLPSPVQTGIISTCTAWYQATDGDDCTLIVDEFGTFSESDFLSWNPAVLSDCSGLVVGDYYCVAVPGTPTTRTASVSALPTPTTPAGTISTCVSYWLVGTGDNCTTIATANGISTSDLVDWNPSLGSNCTGLAVNTYICVGVPSNDTTTISSSTSINSMTSTSTGATTTTTAGATPSPIQTGMTTGCIRFYKVQANNDCYDIALDAGVALSDLYAWNPAIGSDCSGLQANVFVCVGTSGYATTITSGDPVPVTPTPTQTGMVSGCLRFYDVQSNDDCYDLASEAGVQLSDFYSWNPALGTDCAGLEASTYVCIGTTGPITTINSGTPVPATATATATA